jgi:hypothetical protein
MKQSLFQLTKSQLEILSFIEEKDGELDEIDEATLTISQEMMMSKTIDYIAMIEHMNSEIERGKLAKKRVEDFMKEKQRVVDRLENALLTAVVLFGPIQAGFHKVSSRKSPSVRLDDESLIPKNYISTKVVESIDKMAIRRDINAGIAVSGATLVQNDNLSIK